MSPEVLPFERSSQGARAEPNQLDTAGQAILRLLNQAADTADQNSRQAIEAAEQLSQRLRATEEQIAQLEAEVEASRQKAERAEEWLLKIYKEIENRFVQQDSRRRAARS